MTYIPNAVFTFDIPAERTPGVPEYPEAVERLKKIFEEIQAAEKANWGEKINWSGPRHLHPAKYGNNLGVRLYHPDHGDPSRLRFESDFYPDVIYLCKILKYVVANYNLSPIDFSWSSGHGKNRGGGAAFITRDRVKMVTSKDWTSHQYTLYNKSCTFNTGQ